MATENRASRRSLQNQTVRIKAWCAGLNTTRYSKL
jgi:hypothetical protein